MRLPLIFAIPNGEYPAGASGSPCGGSTRAEGTPTVDMRALRDLKAESEFTTFPPSGNWGAADAVPIKKAAIDVIRVILEASMAFSSCQRCRKSGIAVSGTLYAGIFTIGDVKRVSTN